MSVPPAAFAQRSLNAPVGSEIYDRIWNDFLTKFKSHLDEKGWFDKTVLYMDETREPTMKPVIKLIQANNPNWKIGLAGSHVSAATENALFDYSSILGSERETASTPGRISTFYTSCSQLFPNAYVTARTSPAEMPWMAWYAANTHRDGYLRWAYDYWT
ncbi:MAG TPA: glycoside hydrolase domain-containing protein, partial [Tepidisphaeraceae bacterium]|nr:glycoside hydrolase domain-containing protein [Tepidisphaeraceae bacterium]